MNNGLTLVDVGLGISRLVLGLQGMRVYDEPFATVAARISTVQVVAGAASLTLVGGALGAGLAALGTLNALARKRAAAISARSSR